MIFKSNVAREESTKRIMKLSQGDISRFKVLMTNEFKKMAGDNVTIEYLNIFYNIITEEYNIICVILIMGVPCIVTMGVTNICNASALVEELNEEIARNIRKIRIHGEYEFKVDFTSTIAGQAAGVPEDIQEVLDQEVLGQANFAEQAERARQERREGELVNNQNNIVRADPNNYNYQYNLAPEHMLFQNHEPIQGFNVNVLNVPLAPPAPFQPDEPQQQEHRDPH
jgi:hypothetical protein